MVLHWSSGGFVTWIVKLLLSSRNNMYQLASKWDLNMRITSEKCREDFYKACKFVVPQTDWKTLGVLTFKRWWWPKCQVSRGTIQHRSRTHTTSTNLVDDITGEIQGRAVASSRRLVRVTVVSRNLPQWCQSAEPAQILNQSSHSYSRSYSQMHCMVIYLTT